MFMPLSENNIQRIYDVPEERHPNKNIPIINTGNSFIFAIQNNENTIKPIQVPKHNGQFNIFILFRIRSNIEP